jgi:hypothetical protein
MILQHLSSKVDHYQQHQSAEHNVPVPPDLFSSTTTPTEHASLPPLARVLTCIQCSLILAREDSIFRVPGASGTIGAYVNPHGFWPLHPPFSHSPSPTLLSLRVVHQTLTTQNVCELSTFLVGEPTAEQSWFPGYCWTIAYCNRCFLHLGWRFTREGRLSSGFCNEFWSVALFALYHFLSHLISPLRGLRRAAVACETRPESEIP